MQARLWSEQTGGGEASSSRMASTAAGGMTLLLGAQGLHRQPREPLFYLELPEKVLSAYSLVINSWP